jgi:hypothetical protein
VLSQVCCAGFGAALLDGVAGVAGAAAAAGGGGGAAADAIATAGLGGVAAGAAAADELTLAELQTLASGDTTTSTRTGRPTGTSPAELRDTSRVRGFARARMPWQAGAGQAGAGAEAVELRAPVLLRLHQDADAHQERRGRDLFVVGDAVRWRQLLVNLISNVTKFTKFTK